jgi:hypothetical protein
MPYAQKWEQRKKSMKTIATRPVSVTAEQKNYCFYLTQHRKYKHNKNKRNANRNKADAR